MNEWNFNVHHDIMSVPIVKNSTFIMARMKQTSKKSTGSKAVKQSATKAARVAVGVGSAQLPWMCEIPRAYLIQMKGPEDMWLKIA